jgi:hypothetical protein
MRAENGSLENREIGPWMSRERRATVRSARIYLQ